MDIVKLFVALVFGYLLGSLNTAVIVGKIYGMDIRSHGSKSAGLTNTLRTLGKAAAGFVLLGDILKGIIACFIGLLLGVYFYSGGAMDSEANWVGYYGKRIDVHDFHQSYEVTFPKNY